MLDVRNGRVGGLKGVSTPRTRSPRWSGRDSNRTRAAGSPRRCRPDLAVQILTAIAERDQAVQTADEVAADAVRALLAEHLNVVEIADLCGGQVEAKELARLSRISPMPATTSGVKS